MTSAWGAGGGLGPPGFRYTHGPVDARWSWGWVGVTARADDRVIVTGLASAAQGGGGPDTDERGHESATAMHLRRPPK